MNTIALLLAQLLAFSTLATDAAQTEHWIQYTEARPYCVEIGVCGWESNPLIAGQPQAFHDLFDFLETGISAAPSMLPENVATVGIAVHGLLQLQAVIRNNQRAPDVGFPRYGMIAWRWSF